MNVFYNPLQRDSLTGGLAVIPEGSDGGRAIAAMLASPSHPARSIECEDVAWTDGVKLSQHIERCHCRVTDAGLINVLPQNEWPENQAQEGGAA